MWILPKQLISAFAPGTEALTLDSSEASKACEQSLMRRSKPSPAKCYLREWKVGNLMRLRSGVISSRSLGQSFEDWWTSSLEATHASHSQQLVGEQDRQMKGTCGHTSQMELLPLSQDYASLKTSKGTSRWDSPQSSVTWKSWVTECRGEYSQRLKLAHLIKESEYSFWPTVSARDWKGCYQTLERKDGKLRGDLLPDAVRIVENGGKCHSLATATKMGTAQSVDSTMQTADVQDLLRMDLNTESMEATCLHEKLQDGLQDLTKSSINGNPQGFSAKENQLNPRWVETLMGLPVGWTMPSCASPVTIEPMNSDS